MTFEVRDGRIAAIEVVTDPARLRALAFALTEASHGAAGLGEAGDDVRLV